MPTKHPRRDGDVAPFSSVTPEQRAAALALDHDAVIAALEGDDPVIAAVISEYILRYAEEAGERLKAGGDYFDLLSPGPGTPALEALAMELVREGFEDELAGEDV